ncbi:STE3-like pheromone receptor, partial [Mycena epipterygia]
MDPTFPLFPFFSAIGFLLSLVPLYWQIEAWNVGAVWYIFWTALSCLNQYFNSLIWAGNTVNSAPAWCEISIRIMMGASVGLPAASMCINRRLYYVASVPPTAVVSKADKRRAIIIDSCICGLFPVLYTALQVVVQRHRFDILEDIGCAPALYNSIATSFISFTWPLLLSFGSAVYCTLSLHAFAAARVTLAAGLSGHRSLTPTRFLRLNALALATLLLTVPLALLTIATNATVAFLSTEASGDVAPFHFALVAQIPRRLWSADASTRAAVELARWVSPACAILFFAFFGLAQEARTNYKRAF